MALQNTDTDLWTIAAQVTDPEIPVLTIEDLGILRDVQREGEDAVVVTITPTYSGCPAMGTIQVDLENVFSKHGLGARVELVLTPAWSTDWMSEEGKAKLEAYGIAPPTGTKPAGPVSLGLTVKCPRCHSLKTKELSRFGSTSCKALYQCQECLEPFDYFKVLS
ncbi:1,2-phenylacetyl-CoA epoxidase subunit PaaD [Zhihengliuella flava]|uniref:Ring-1,2-phenylacetyl-CoA epoxidase subunit PaaD n=1 Tax=Zhihengliuella flava TaxID=1285193 RepID=A0A931D5I7_9MICC|nr:1,2-phenylacetyl-CoA epoxidase subunit PaaD [Zhihengliuella flava]MBG6084100.1 ring-1,2-phenylacetyl-CoA epoxidase subunit PaaD [Zhihengliuella flava]